MSIMTIPISDLRRNLSTIIPKLTQPLFVTQHGRVKAVLLDIDEYNDMLDELEEAEIVRSPEYRESLADAKAGRGIPLEDVLKKYDL